MNVKYINPFLTATINVIKTMAFTEAKPSKPFLKKEQKAMGDVSGVIGLSGDVMGSMSITFEEDTILHIISNMFGEPITEINDEVRDAVGEITNMISGDARRMLQAEGVTIEAAIPSIITGKNHTITHMAKGPIIAIPFETEKGKFFIEFTLEEN